MSRNGYASNWETVSIVLSIPKGNGRLPNRVSRAAGGVARDDFTKGTNVRVAMPKGREISKSNRSGDRKIVPGDY